MILFFLHITVGKPVRENQNFPRKAMYYFQLMFFLTYDVIFTCFTLGKSPISGKKVSELTLIAHVCQIHDVNEPVSELWYLDDLILVILKISML